MRSRRTLELANGTAEQINKAEKTAATNLNAARRTFALQIPKHIRRAPEVPCDHERAETPPQAYAAFLTIPSL